MTTTTDTRAGESAAPVRAAAGIGGALAAGGRAYVAGLLELGRAMGGFGREIAGETGEHVRATVRARNLRELAELQAAFAQRRVEMSATYAKELVDLARARSEEVIAPIAGLIGKDKGR
jgi:phasin family protein